MANYYDKVLEDYGEGILDDSYDEGILDDSYDEGILDEARGGKRRPQPRVPNSVGKSSNFGRNISSSPQSGNYATKAELKSSLNSISDQVNDLKKSSLSLASGIKRLDDGYEKVIKSIAKKDRAQDSVMGNTTMMTLMGTIINRPTFDPSTLKVVETNSDDIAKAKAASNTTTPIPDPVYAIQLDSANTDPINVDLTKTLLFTMLPTMIGGSGSGSDNNNMMMMMMVLLLGTNNSGSSSGNALLGSGSGSNSNNNLLLIMMMMMMMNKK